MAVILWKSSTQANKTFTIKENVFLLFWTLLKNKLSIKSIFRKHKQVGQVQHPLLPVELIFGANWLNQNVVTPILNVLCIDKPCDAYNIYTHIMLEFFLLNVVAKLFLLSIY